MVPDTLIIVTARDEADRIEATLRGLAHAFPAVPVWVADDGSSDLTACIARRLGATVVRSDPSIGKGGAATLAARDALAQLERDAVAPAGVCDAVGIAGERDAVGIAGERDAEVGLDEQAQRALVPAADVLEESVVVLCDGDLGDSAALLGSLVDAVREQRADLAVAMFSRRVGGGLGLTVGFARWAIRRRCGLKLEAPLSGQRALRVSALADVLPLAEGFGMEIGMTIDAARAGHRVLEVELDLKHRATGRTLSGFAHRARQLLDCLRAYLGRR